MEDKFGYHQDLKNGDGVVRARTTGHLRSWDIPRTLHALEVLKKEWGNLEYPRYISVRQKIFPTDSKPI